MAVPPVEFEQIGHHAPTTDAVVDTVKRVQPSVLSVAMTLATHLLTAGELIEPCPDTTILAGGRSFAMVPDRWQRVGADGSAGDARQAGQLAATLVSAP